MRTSSPSSTLQHATDEDLVKLANLYFLEAVLLQKDPNSYVNMDHVHILEDLDDFYLYPWGRLVFHETLKHFRNAVKSNEKGSEKKPKGYHLAGFPFAVLAFIFESIPLLSEQEFAFRTSVHFPQRVLNWKYIGGANWKSLEKQVFDAPQVSIKNFYMFTCAIKMLYFFYAYHFYKYYSNEK